ncbi:MAG: M20/M25/M40 family metallo-hydrolase [Planctomycetes bacterium]|nr:M20/M25/M40 family metallo-hydrolase [Planctomycetota bacterium]MCB9905317.1 M20/M25/M40 family metallo-hydrolase [Planctomycetota bacterium]
MRSTRHASVLPALILLLPALGACISSEPELTRKKLLERVPKSALALDSDVAWLSDDAREGRRAGMQGERDTAAWLARQLGAIGLEPAGEDGYFQRFPVPLAARVGDAPSVSKEVRLASGQRATVRQRGAMEPLFCSTSGEVTGSLVFRGYGIVDEERGHDDYASGRVDGAIVLLRRGTPADDDASWGFGGSVLHKVMTAKRNGAAAVIITQDAADGEPLRFSDGHEANAGIPCAYVDPELAAWLFSSDHEEATAAERAQFRGVLAGAAPLEGPGEVTLDVDVRREDGVATNVLGVLRGRGEAKTIVVGAHYDHLGLGGTGSLAPETVGQIHNGADDNASGTAAVLEIARILAANEPPPGDVVFALWSGEELGLLGSRHWCEHPTVPLDRISMNVNLDMVGRAESNGLEVMGVGTSPPFADWAHESAAAAGLDAELTVSGFGVGGSDHQSFLEVGIPAIHLFTGLHDDYHKPSDDLIRFEERGAAQIVALCVDFIGRAQRGGELAFIEPPKDPNAQGGRRGFDVRFGSRPADYSETGGLTLAGVSPGTPAERAGLMAGDTLLEVGGVRIDGIQDFVYVLRTHKPGDVLKTVYRRDGKEESVLITLDSNVVE